MSQAEWQDAAYRCLRPSVDLVGGLFLESYHFAGSCFALKGQHKMKDHNPAAVILSQKPCKFPCDERCHQQQLIDSIRFDSICLYKNLGGILSFSLFYS